MPRLVAALVRHGAYHQSADTPSAHQPYPLTARGEQHARTGAADLRQLLEAHQLTLHPECDCSTVLRAWQTANVMAEAFQSAHGASVTLASFDALAERSVGAAANLTARQIEQILAADSRFDTPPAGWKADSQYCLPFPGAESLMQAGRRVAQHLRVRMDDLAATARNDTLKVFVGHGAAFRHAAHLLGALDFAEIAALSMHHGRPVLLEYRPGAQWRHLDGTWKQRHSDEPPTD